MFLNVSYNYKKVLIDLQTCRSSYLQNFMLQDFLEISLQLGSRSCYVA